MVSIILDDLGRPHAITSTGKGLYKRAAGDQSRITQCNGGSRGRRKGPAVLQALKGREQGVQMPLESGKGKEWPPRACSPANSLTLQLGPPAL